MKFEKKSITKVRPKKAGSRVGANPWQMTMSVAIASRGSVRRV
jgi:hypothetical protein